MDMESNEQEKGNSWPPTCNEAALLQVAVPGASSGWWLPSTAALLPQQHRL
jgi:hypothetical protein